MRVHHLDCGSLREVPPVAGPGNPTEPIRAVCHCLLLETDRAGLVLVDTGLGRQNVEHPTETLGLDWMGWAQPRLDIRETAVEQVRAKGFATEDVRHIVVTHLHRDHSGGLPDFPHARVHVGKAELEHALGSGVTSFPQRHWEHGPDWVPHDLEADGEKWRGFEGVRDIEGVDGVLLLPLQGHTPGQLGVAVNDVDRWLVHAGDAYFYHGEIRADPPSAPEFFDALQAGSEHDRERRLANRDRLRSLARNEDAEVFSAHDPWEYAELRR